MKPIQVRFNHGEMGARASLTLDYEGHLTQQQIDELIGRIDMTIVSVIHNYKDNRTIVRFEGNLEDALRDLSVPPIVEK
jgi:DNA integrity scanning protein DisA with diadenylate cyclase activity